MCIYIYVYIYIYKYINIYIYIYRYQYMALSHLLPCPEPALFLRIICKINNWS